MKTVCSSRSRLLLVGSVVALLVVGSTKADFTFGPPQNLGPVVNSVWNDSSCCTSADDLELYFASNRPGGLGAWDLYVSTRQSIDDPWGPPVNLGPAVNSVYEEWSPSLSSDGLTLYFSESAVTWPPRPGPGTKDIWMTSRVTRSAPWTTPVAMGGPINSPYHEISPSISGDGLLFVFAYGGPGAYGGSGDLFMSTRATLQDAWGPPVNLGPSVNTSGWEGECSVSKDGLAVCFCSDRSGGYHLWVSTRKRRSDPWGPPVNLGPLVNSTGSETDAGISSDGRTLYFDSNRSGGLGDFDLYAAPIIPIVDFNGDEKVDLQDLLRLIESWGRDDSSVDVGPMPWGDGVVDAKDLEVLMSYWGQEIPSPALIAHWKLDEAEGIVAADSAGTIDGALVGDPTWQPAGGKLGGALQLDGADDYVATEFVCDPSEGPFSIFAWVKGGAPGQVIISQQGGTNWLVTSSLDGTLMTDLKSSGRQSRPLASTAAITDGAWHRLGLVWDGSNRILYVDDIEVARDTQVSLTGSCKGLYLGAGSTLTAGTFWAGLIDDVSIYDRAVKP